MGEAMAVHSMAEVVPAMTLDEAMYLDRRANETFDSAMEFVDVMCRMREFEGWRLLGYDSWTAYTASKRTGISQASVFRKLEAALVAKELERSVESVSSLRLHNPSAVPGSQNENRAADVPESHLRALAKAPEGTRAEVLDVATKAAEGRRTEKVVRAAVEAKKAKPDALPIELVADTKTIVNGERKADASVERQRAAGVIPSGVEVVVEDPGEDAGDSIEAAKEERAEAAAKADDLTDDEWLATLPLASLLAGVSLSRFKADALYYRRFEPVRRSLLAFHGKARSVYRGSFRGVAGYAVERLLKIEHPSRWRRCPPTDKDGCGGEGVVPIVGECGLCKGRGYLAH